MGWKRYLGLEYIDYTDQIFQSLVKTRYAKRQFSLILSMTITFIIRWHIKMFFSFFFQVHPVFDFVLQVFLSVLLVLKSRWIHNFVMRFQSEIYALSRYLINNYSAQNYRVWKRNVTLCVCLYFLVNLIFIEVTSALLIEYILQFLISYFIVDGIEQGTFIRFYRWCSEKIGVQCRVFTRKKSAISIQEDYLENYSSEEEEEEGSPVFLRKSWMGLENVVVVEDSPTHSLVLFED